MLIILVIYESVFTWFYEKLLLKHKKLAMALAILAPLVVQRYPHFQRYLVAYVNYSIRDLRNIFC